MKTINNLNQIIQGVPEKMIHQPAATEELMDHFFWDTLQVPLFQVLLVCLLMNYGLQILVNLKGQTFLNFKQIQQTNIPWQTLNYVKYMSRGGLWSKESTHQWRIHAFICDMTRVGRKKCEHSPEETACFVIFIYVTASTIL